MLRSILEWLTGKKSHQIFMGIRLGNFDILQLIFNIINVLMRRGLLTADDTREIIRNSLPPEMPEEEKNRIIDSMVHENRQ